MNVRNQYFENNSIIVQLHFFDDLCTPSPGTLLGSLALKTNLELLWANVLCGWLGADFPSVVVIVEEDCVF